MLPEQALETVLQSDLRAALKLLRKFAPLVAKLEEACEKVGVFLDREVCVFNTRVQFVEPTLSALLARAI